MAGRKPGPLGRLIKITLGIPEDMLAEYGPDTRTRRVALRDLVIRDVRSRRAEAGILDTESDGAVTESPV